MLRLVSTDGSDTASNQAALRASDPVRPNEPAPQALLAAWVRGALSGDVSATQRLLQYVAPHVRRTVKGMLGAQHPDLEDTIQEALLAFIKALPAFRFESEINHYVVRIAFRVALATKRRTKRFTDRFELTSAPEQTPGTESPAAREVDLAGEQRRALERALAKLPHAQAEVIVLWLVLEHSIAEVASICDVSPNTVKSRLRLAREALHRHVQSDAALRLARERA
jgi:RNA polymerase sigma-70 factor (ECF subfamily)